MTEKTCIVGAGPSGIAAAKTLSERGIPFDAFEMGSDVGGIWRFENDNGRSPAYASLRTNTSRDKTGYSDLPMPESYPDYPSHEQMLDYLEAYVARFHLRQHIHFRTRVAKIHPALDGSYEVTSRAVDGGAVQVGRYESVIVASGHHWKPFRPDFPGTFHGRELHSNSYRRPDAFAGKRVLVVGIGNSACDIVCEISRVADRTYLSTRRRAHVIPKHLLGRPLDHWLTPLSARLPFRARQTLFKLLIYLERGAQHRYGLPPPEHSLGEEHPTISTELLPLIREGAIEPKPDVAALNRDRVSFVDGTEARVDTIIYATGYLTCFPFLDFIEVEDNNLPLFHHVVHPSWPGLYFLGLVQPLGALPPLAEAQADWVADLIEGRGVLPSSVEMEEAVEQQDAMLRRRYVNSRRHRTEVEVYPYLRALRKEQQAGRRRAGGAAGVRRSDRKEDENIPEPVS